MSLYDSDIHPSLRAWDVRPKESDLPRIAHPTMPAMAVNMALLTRHGSPFRSDDNNNDRSSIVFSRGSSEEDEPMVIDTRPRVAMGAVREDDYDSSLGADCDSHCHYIVAVINALIRQFTRGWSSEQEKFILRHLEQVARSRRTCPCPLCGLAWSDAVRRMTGPHTTVVQVLQNDRRRLATKLRELQTLYLQSNKLYASLARTNAVVADAHQTAWEKLDAIFAAERPLPRVVLSPFMDPAIRLLERDDAHLQQADEEKVERAIFQKMVRYHMNAEKMDECVEMLVAWDPDLADCLKVRLPMFFAEES